jgi:hypothetical protein
MRSGDRPTRVGLLLEEERYVSRDHRIGDSAFRTF